MTNGHAAHVHYSRRTVLAAGAALPLLSLPSACVSAKLPSTEVAFADTHLHLFNAHDLPAGTFLVDVVFARQDLPRLLKAVIDTIARAIQPVAISAQREKARLEGTSRASDGPADWTPESFGARIGAWARNPSGLAPAMDEDRGTPLHLFVDVAEMRAAYDELIAAVAAQLGPDHAAATVDRAADSGAIDEAFARLARTAETPQGPGPSLGPVSAAPLDCRTPCPDRPIDMSVSAILRYLGWGYLMLKSRQAHLDDYVRMSRRHGEFPRLVLNHLVDYDSWLGELRLRGSSHSDQIEVAGALARTYAVPRPERPAIEMKTFAGFCPLKHALEIRRSGRPTSFEAQLALHAAGKIAGFKLYPPMGFRPSGNAALANREFDPQSNYRAEHFRRWAAEFGSSADGHEIGAALDASLESFYATCARLDISLMAHAGPGNGAGPDFGQRANPFHWRPVVEKHRLRLSLGHLVSDAENFVCALRTGQTPPCVWALGASRHMLDPSQALQGRVWGDLAYMPELIRSRALAAEFFRLLNQVYGQRDPKLTRILYGSDYVMLGNMADYDRHLSAIRDGMNAAGYDEDMIHNILFANARRFLQA